MNFGYALMQVTPKSPGVTLPMCTIPPGSPFEFKPIQTDLVNLQLLAIKDCEESYSIQSTSFCLRDSPLVQQENIPTERGSRVAARATPECLYSLPPRELSHRAWFSPSEISNLQRWLNKVSGFSLEFTRTFWGSQICDQPEPEQPAQGDFMMNFVF